MTNRNFGKLNYFCLTQAVDADSIPSISYILSGTNSEDFTVQNVNGVANVLVSRSLDYETRRTYNLFMTTSDGQNSNIPGASASLFIEVLVSSLKYLFKLLNDAVHRVSALTHEILNLAILINLWHASCSCA